jgi:hypothetical protein
MQIYESEGYNPRDAAKLILEKNIYGLDIDRRAYQLAYFSLMMKARQYNRRIFTEAVKPQVYHPAGFSDGEEYGSLVHIDKLEPMPEQPKEQQMTLFDGSYEVKLNAWNFKRLLAQKYDVVVTNPPYMGSRGMNNKLNDYVQERYPNTKSDMFAVFIEKCREYAKENGYYAMITQPSFLFLTAFENLRKGIIREQTIISLLHMGRGIFGIDFGSTAFIIKNSHTDSYIGMYLKLHQRTFQYLEPDDIANLYLLAKENHDFVFDFSTYNSNEQEERDDFAIEVNNQKLYYATNQEDFLKIPGTPVAYWLSKAFLTAFQSQKLGNSADVITGMTTGNNNEFLRLWHEVSREAEAIGFSKMEDIDFQKCKWIPYSKGGNRRNWSGNGEYVVNWIRKDEFNRSKTTLQHLYLREALTWPFISSGKFSARYLAEGYLWDVAGSPCFFNDRNNLFYALGFLCTKIADSALKIMNPTINIQAIDLAKLPFINNDDAKPMVVQYVKQNITLSDIDWNSFETSWDFERHPLICDERMVASAFTKWESEAAERFNTLKANEEELNRIFIDIYGLQDELTPDVEDKDVTVRRADLGREIRSLISYAVGCMFGRYSLDTEGLAYAGGNWDAGKYSSFIPDKDNILPICDDEYFDDDIMGRFVDFIRVVYGADTLEENLKFIADALGGNGTPREVIRNYFLNDFYKDHCKIYQKRPIYWLFDSGKKNGFKALIYLHRYSRDLLAKLRTDYVHEQQERYRTQLSHIATALNTATGSERARLLKQQDKLSEQLKEITAFEEKVHHLADQNIEIDLDDGVKKNYKIFTDVLAKI